MGAQGLEELSPGEVGCMRLVGFFGKKQGSGTGARLEASEESLEPKDCL